MDVVFMDKENNIALIDEELNVITYEVENIKNLIYCIRGKQVMLDSDVSMLYHYETKKINQAVKRNIERFPEKFCFQLNENEIKNLRFQNRTLSMKKSTDSLRSQFVTLNKNGRGQHRKYLPYVFTEQGIAMLSGSLKNEIAVKVSINIIDAFVEMRKFIANNGQIFSRLTNVEYKLLEQCKELSNHEKKFEKVFNELQKNQEEEFKQKIFFNGQIWDSYSLIIDIIKRAQQKILIIDNYIDDSILKMLAKKSKGVEVVILTSQNSNLTKLDINKFNKQYPILKVAITNKFHDRFIVIDNKELYHCRCITKRCWQKMFCNF